MSEREEIYNGPRYRKPIEATAHDESEALRKRSEAWFRNYILTGTISEDELLNIPDPTEKPVQPFIRET